MKNEIATVRMSDVAREAGVARVTVSRVLSEPHAVAPAKREAVLAAIARLGYVPDLTAGALATRRSRLVGGIVPSLATAWFSDTIDGFSDALAAAGYQLLLGQTRYREGEEAQLIDTFLGRRVDALMLTGSTRPPAVRERLLRAGLPVVETWDLPQEPIDMGIGFCNRGAGEVAARHLLSRGCRRLGYIGTNEERSLQRLKGFAEASGEAIAQELGAPPSSFEAGACGLRALLARQPGLDGLFCSNDTMAAGALFACQRAGIEVPRRLAIVGFSDQPIAAATFPALTTVQVRSREMGRRAASMLLARLSGQPMTDRVVDLGYRIVERESA